jgi:hypothetical protein
MNTAHPEFKSEALLLEPTRSAAHVAKMRTTVHTVSKYEGRNPLGKRDVNGRIILKLILNKVISVLNKEMNFVIS